MECYMNNLERYRRKTYSAHNDATGKKSNGEKNNSNETGLG